jgi:hypothetical protein
LELNSNDLFISLFGDSKQIIGERRGYLELKNICHNEDAMKKLAAALAQNTTVTTLELHRYDFSPLQLSTVAWKSFANALKVNTTITVQIFKAYPLKTLPHLN